jgi:hypothetical protein
MFAVGCKREPEGSHPYEDRVLIQYNTEDLSELVYDYIAELKHDNHLFFETGYIASGANESILRLEFSTQNIMELSEARALLVDTVEGMLSRLNNSRVGFSLQPYPLTADQLELYIDFQSFHGVHVDPFFIGWVALEQGMAYYYAFNLENDRLDFWNSRTEPYAKSRSFVMLERQGEAKYKAKHPHKEKKLGDTHFYPENVAGTKRSPIGKNFHNT